MAMNTFLPVMMLKSIGLAAANATVSPGVLDSWVAEIEKHVAENGKFSKSQAGYLPFAPPPLFWDYRCLNCRFWVEPDGCQVVSGRISPSGWCVIWLPPDDKPAFSWIKELR